MKGDEMTSEVPELSAAKRALLEKYLRGEVPSALAVKKKEEIAPIEPVEERQQVPVVPIQTKGTRQPVFYMHVHVQGGAFYNFALARYLGEDQPFYMLDPYMFDEGHMPPTLEQMAEVYVQSLRSAQPEGPYLLAGFCGGGIIAFEMAQQLRAQGQKVEMLVCIEPRDGPAPHRILFRKMFAGSIRRIGALLRLSPEKQLEAFLRIRYIGLHLARSSYRTDKDFSFFPSIEFLRRDWIGVFVWIISQYNTRKYPGKVIYYWAREEARSIRTWWGKVVEAEELEVHLLPGSHTTCRTDHLEDLAAQLGRNLDEAQNRTDEYQL
jgi:pimeloyl-ACP methyl ester carboxylesterase